MPDTVRSLAALQALFADNTNGDISPQDLRDFLVSVMGRTKAVWLPIEAAIAVLGSPDKAVRGDTGNTWQRATAWAFDGTGGENITLNFAMPADWDGGNVTVSVYWAPSTGDSGNVVWEVWASDLAAGDQIDDSTEAGVGDLASAAPSVAEQLTVVTSSAFALFGSSNLHRIRLGRVGGAASDTYDAHDAWLLGVKISYTAAF